MIRHIVIWKLAPEADKAQIRARLCSLCGNIDGLLSLAVVTEGLPTSAGDLLLETTHPDADALAAYQAHPLHKAVADECIRPFSETRLSMDFEV